MLGAFVITARGSLVVGKECVYELALDSRVRVRKDSMENAVSLEVATVMDAPCACDAVTILYKFSMLFVVIELRMHILLYSVNQSYNFTAVVKPTNFILSGFLSTHYFCFEINFFFRI